MDLHAASAEADVGGDTVPLTQASRDLIDAAALGAMKPTAWIVNTGRGPVINEPAIIDALTDRRIGGAVLDVFEQEPLPRSTRCGRRPTPSSRPTCPAPTPRRR